MGRRSKKRAPGTELGRSPSGVPGAAADIGRWNSRRKTEIALRLLKGEDLDGLSRELNVSTSRLAQWRDDFLAAGQAGLMSREPDARDEEIQRLRAKIGELTMDNELLNQLVDRIEGGQRPPSRRPRS